MLRRFSVEAAIEDIVCSIGAANATAAVTLVALVKPRLISAGRIIQIGNNSEYSEFYSLGLGESGGKPTLFFNKGGKESHALDLSGLAEKWCIFVVTKASGEVKPKFYYFDFESNEWHTAEGNIVIPNSKASPTKIAFGATPGVGSAFHGEYGATMAFKKALTKAEVEELSTASHLTDWLSHSPDGLWLFNQEEISEALNDQTAGGANQIARAGTEVVEGDPPIPYVSGASPAVETGGASPAGEAASIHGLVNPEALATKYYFEWGTTESYGTKTTEESAGEGEADVPVSAEITGLVEGETYHYRLVAKNAHGKTVGSDRSFVAGKSQTQILIAGELVNASRSVLVGGELVSA